MVKRDELKALLSAAGVQPKRPLGQNFLTDPNLLAAIARDADIQPDDVVFEVGTGTGGLTVHLAEQAAHVVTVEVDPALAELATDRLAELDNVTLIHRDVLAAKSRIAEEVLVVLREKLAGGRSVRVCANLPYAIATPVVMHLLELDLPLRRMTVMVQLESAERFLARPGDPTYNAVSVLIAQMATAKHLRKIPPAVFFPRPKVASSVVQLDPFPVRGVKDPVYPALKAIARSLFNYRRKTLLVAARSAAKHHPPLAVVAGAFEKVGIDAHRRAEHLNPEEWQVLAKECAPALAGFEVEEGPEEEEPREGRRTHRNKYAAMSVAPPVAEDEDEDAEDEADDA